MSMRELTLNETLRLFKIISTTNVKEVELRVEEHGDKFTAEKLMTFVARSGMTTYITTPSDSNIN